jgi:mono/diheme cytochrome c family protein/cytochrome c553
VSLRTSLIVLNALAFVVIAGFIIWRVFSIKRNPDERTPANQAEFLPDEDLEGRRLERVLGWSLIFVMIVAVSLPIYFLVEPERQVSAEEGFLERSEERGATLFANKQSLQYDATKSLLCANCHGVTGQGGTAPFVLQPEADICLIDQNKGNANVPECLPKSVNWAAPALNTALLRFDRKQLTQIITYGRPGTPMPAWGVVSGKGVLNEQGIKDLVNYIASIQISTEKATNISTEAIPNYREGGKQTVANANETLAQAQKDLATAQADSSSGAAILAKLQAGVVKAQQQVDAAQAYETEVAGLSDGAILFRLNCARCHTKGWSYYDPTNLDLPPLPPQGSGAYGPSLRGGSLELQFPGEAGIQEQFDWVAIGVPPNNQYGVRGISSGRMPHFGKQLTDDQIKLIVAYERSL